MRPNQILTCLPKIYDIIASKDRHILYTALLYISELLHAFKLIIYCVFIDCGFSSRWNIHSTSSHLTILIRTTSVHLSTTTLNNNNNNPCTSTNNLSHTMNPHNFHKHYHPHTTQLLQTLPPTPPHNFYKHYHPHHHTTSTNTTTHTTTQLPQTLPPHNFHKHYHNTTSTNTTTTQLPQTLPPHNFHKHYHNTTSTNTTTTQLPQTLPQHNFHKHYHHTTSTNTTTTQLPQTLPPTPPHNFYKHYHPHHLHTHTIQMIFYCVVIHLHCFMLYF